MGGVLRSCCSDREEDFVPTILICNESYLSTLRHNHSAPDHSLTSRKSKRKK